MLAFLRPVAHDLTIERKKKTTTTQTCDLNPEMFECIISRDAATNINNQHPAQQVLRRVRHGIPYFTGCLAQSTIKKTDIAFHTPWRSDGLPIKSYNTNFNLFNL